MFEPEIKEVKRVFVKNEDKKKQDDKKDAVPPIASPIIDGRKFIGSGEDANVFFD